MSHNRDLSAAAAQIGFNNSNIGIGTDIPAQTLDVYNGNISLYAPTHEQSIRLRTNRGTIAELVHLSGDGALRLYTGEVTPTLRTYISSYGNTYFNPNAGNVGIGTDNPVDKLVVHQGSDDDIIVRVNGADSTTEFAGLGVGSGYASFVAGGSQTTNTDMVLSLIHI